MNDLIELKDPFEDSLKHLVLTRTPESLSGLREMVSFHFGWNDPSSKTGKRLRPIGSDACCCGNGSTSQLHPNSR